MNRHDAPRSGRPAGAWRRLLRHLRPVLPELPDYRVSGDIVIAQAVVLRRVERGPEVVLVKRTSPRAWELPGGLVEPGEHPADAVVREVAEETGLEVTIDFLLGWYRRTGFRPHSSPVFVCRAAASGPLHCSREAVAVRYFPVARLPLGLFPWYRPVIASAVDGNPLSGERRQHLGLGAVLAGSAIHLGELAGILP